MKITATALNLNMSLLDKQLKFTIEYICLGFDEVCVKNTGPLRTGSSNRYVLCARAEVT